jgi:Protein of unknown function (DUF1232)
MLEVIKLSLICFTVMTVVLPVAFLVALSLPRNSEFRQLCLRVCYWGVAVAAVGYFAMPIDCIPDVFFPVGFADDLIALGIGLASARKAMKPRGGEPSCN